MAVTCYKMGSEDFGELLSRITDKSKPLTDKDREKLLGLMKGFWFFMNDFLETKMTKAQLKKLVELGVLPSDFSAEKKDDESAETGPGEKGESQKSADEESNAEITDEVDEEIDLTEEEEEIESDEISPDEQNSDRLDDNDEKNCSDEETGRHNHGRNGYSDFPADSIASYSIDGLAAGMQCPSCFDGILYPYRNGVVLQIEEQSPLASTHHLLEKFRCSTCQVIVSPDLEGFLEDGFGRYSFGAVAMIAVYRYGYGFPFHRLEEILKQYRLPISDSAMWDHVLSGYHLLKALIDAFWVAAANGLTIKIDDGTGRVIEHQLKIAEELAEAKRNGLPESSVRTGIHTTCVYAETEQGDLRLFSTGRRHCGENFWDMVEARSVATSAPLMRMTDCGSTNTESPPKNSSPPPQIIFLYCLQHARDRFVKAQKYFPDKARHVLDLLGKVYKNDKIAKERSLSPQKRLELHQKLSKPLMEEIQSWCKGQLDDHLVEPNDLLGHSMTYFLKHYEDLTGFMRVEGAALDNNLCEQTVKTVKRHQKASGGYLTSIGAVVGDGYMTIIESAKLADLPPGEYIDGCFKNSEALINNPELFLPWNFRETMKTLSSAANFKDQHGPAVRQFSVPAKFKSETQQFGAELH